MQTRRKITKTKRISTRKLPLTGNLYRKNKRRISFSKLLRMSFLFVAFLSITFVVLYGLFLYNKTNAESVNQDVVLKELSQIIVLPDEPVVSLVRVSDAKKLANQNSFYQSANLANGDYIIIYKDIIIIYNFDKNLIKKIKTDIKDLEDFNR